MSDYKLVPVGPTPEMVESAESAYMLFEDMELALMMAVLAAPPVQGVPVAYLVTAIRPAPEKPYLTIKRTQVEALQQADHLRSVGCTVTVEALGRYTAPQPAEQQPAPDVAGLVEALESHEEELFQVRQDRDTHFGALIRALEQVDAMKAECEKLRTAMAEAKSHIEHYMYGGSSYCRPAEEAIAIIDAAMEGDKP